MTMRWAMASAALWVLAACQPAPLADSAADPLRGVGFGDYESYLAERQAREAQLGGAVASAPEATGAPSGAAAGVPGLTAADLAAAGIGVTASAGQAVAAAPGPTATVTGAPRSDELPRATDAPLAAPGMARPGREQVITPAAGGAPGAETGAREGVVVSPAETSRTGAAATARPRATVESRPAPERSTDTGADIVAYALRTSNAVGEPLYRRVLASEGRAARQCRRFAGADLAQRAFLEAGGPYRDRLGLDPDGDGFACGWNPAPFRAARG